MPKRVIIGIVVCFGLVMPIQAQTYKGTLGKYSIMLSIQDDAVSTYMGVVDQIIRLNATAPRLSAALRDFLANRHTQSYDFV
ncbi:hypothetical protein H0S63_11725 [Shewanella algae]|uniref:hypothetical protein n=6 Tax=Shewanella algae TaxID=38313 RepID=UPI00165622CC|nr:hypothetical protein [Shewanella algae]MBC8796494.1 hypothetical protein [Shewanella algae]MBO2599820.1 hypothetical protein [Shewanella algae]MBO2623576.1 hypothetical protein [Shewanella algae]BCV29354.1 hypothetical protein TUM3811_32140 [Shewanella algae]